MIPTIDNEFRMRVFGLYPNAKVAATNKVIYNMVALDFKKSRILVTRPDEKDKWLYDLAIENIQLILKPLLEITEQEGIELAEIFDETPENFKSEFDDYSGIVESLFNETPGYFINAYSVDQYSQFIDYLRQHNYITKYMGKDPYECGIAIKSNKI